MNRVVILEKSPKKSQEKKHNPQSLENNHLKERQVYNPERPTEIPYNEAVQVYDTKGPTESPRYDAGKVRNPEVPTEIAFYKSKKVYKSVRSMKTDTQEVRIKRLKEWCRKPGNVKWHMKR